jgi:hypothetical protein
MVLALEEERRVAYLGGPAVSFDGVRHDVNEVVCRDVYSKLKSEERSMKKSFIYKSLRASASLHKVFIMRNKSGGKRPVSLALGNSFLVGTGPRLIQRHYVTRDPGWGLLGSGENLSN